MPASILVAAAIAAVPSVAVGSAPGFDELSLELPGIPAAVVPADMNGDGRRDLVVLVAYSAWGQTATTERSSFDGVEGLVEVMSVVSSLIDHRELRVYPATADGGYEASPAVLEVDDSIHVLEAGSAAEPLLAVTDDGVAAVRYAPGDGGGTLSLVPLLATPTVFAGSGAFFADYPILAPLDGDAIPDLLLPTADGWSIFRGTWRGFEGGPASRVARIDPEEDGSDSASDSDSDSDSESARRRPRPPERPVVADQNADGRPDLLLIERRSKPVVYLNLGRLAFAPAVRLDIPRREANEEIVHVGSLDGGPGSSLVSQSELELADDAGMRVAIDHAKRPDFFYSVYPLDATLAVPAAPRTRFVAEGYTFAGTDDPGEDLDVRLPGGFKDLDGDGRLDLVAITLEFAVLPVALGALVTQRLALTMDFHPWCQQEDGSFRRVPGLDLSGRFKINLRSVQVKHLSQFAGDFDGDGRADFVQLGRGRRVTIHHGRPGCDYPLDPSATLRLRREPRHLGLVRILDLDGDARSDLYVVHPLGRPRPGESIPVRLDLYRSVGGR